jgi:hypothetical protein
MALMEEGGAEILNKSVLEKTKSTVPASLPYLLQKLPQAPSIASCLTEMQPVAHPWYTLNVYTPKVASQKFLFIIILFSFEGQRHHYTTVKSLCGKEGNGNANCSFFDITGVNLAWFVNHIWILKTPELILSSWSVWTRSEEIHRD